MGSADHPKQSIRVFISSSYLDNAERRRVVEDAVIRAGMQPVGMERFGPSHLTTVEECERIARECDVYVGIVAHRYGWVPDGRETSITEIEYDAAKEAGRPRFMLEIDPKLPVNPDRDFDEGPDLLQKQEKLEAFRKKYRADQMPGLFTEVTLSGMVVQCLNDYVANEGRATRQRWWLLRRSILVASILAVSIVAWSIIDRTIPPPPRPIVTLGITSKDAIVLRNEGEQNAKLVGDSFAASVDGVPVENWQQFLEELGIYNEAEYVWPEFLPAGKARSILKVRGLNGSLNSYAGHMSFEYCYCSDRSDCWIVTWKGTVSDTRKSPCPDRSRFNPAAN